MAREARRVEPVPHFTTMTEWITDRRPTETDADPDGYVRMRSHPDDEHNAVTVHWLAVSGSAYWTHTPDWKPLPTIRVGQVWQRADGVEVTVYIDDQSGAAPLRIGPTSETAFWYKRSGAAAFVSDRAKRLVRLIADAPETASAAEPKATEIPAPIRTGAEPFYVLVISDDSRGQDGGSPIVWEHPIPGSTTLQDVLRKQCEIGSRYGTTHVAECRIIPELTREVQTDA